jgi:hypothetical protein
MTEQLAATERVKAHRSENRTTDYVEQMMPPLGSSFLICAIQKYVEEPVTPAAHATAISSLTLYRIVVYYTDSAGKVFCFNS